MIQAALLLFLKTQQISVYEKFQTTRPCISPTLAYTFFKKSHEPSDCEIQELQTDCYIYAIRGTCIWCLNFPSGSDPKWISYASMLGGGVLWYTVVFFATSKQMCKSRADSWMRVECAKPGRDGRKGKWHPESGTSPWKGPGAFVDLSDQIDSYWF